MNDMTVIEKVCRALGRTKPIGAPPPPPALPEPIVRLVHTDLGLPELFAKRAADQKMGVSPVYVDELLPKLIQFLRDNKIKSIALPVSPLLAQLGLVDGLRGAGFDVRTWDEMTLDDVYEVDCGITDVTYAVAETGSLVIKTSPQHGRALSLVPLFHVAIVEPKNLLPDLLDLFEKLAAEGAGPNVVMISGPSKTADIEMNVVTGVHGPNVVQAFLLS